jgi:hypothetical protein
MKRAVRPFRSVTAMALLLTAAAACGLQEHPQGGAVRVDDPGTGPVDPVPPPAPTAPTPGIDQPPAPTPPPSPGAPTVMPPGTGTPPGGAPTPPPPAAMPGPGLMINGSFVPKEKAIVIIHWGHSNMYGQAESPNSLRPFFFDTQPGLWSFRGSNRFSLAKEKTAPAPDGDSNSNGGPGMAILRTLQAAAPADGGYQFISIGRGQGSATTEQYLKGGLYYSTFMNLAMQLKGRVTFGAVFVMMGITDRHMPLRSQSGFTDRMTRIVADIRADLGEPNLPVLHTDYEVTSTGNLAPTAEFGRRIRPLILALPERVSNLAIIPCDDIPLEDDHHFTLAGHKMWAERGVELMRERGWFPWARTVPPN